MLQFPVSDLRSAVGEHLASSPLYPRPPREWSLGSSDGSGWLGDTDALAEGSTELLTEGDALGLGSLELEGLGSCELEGLGSAS